MVRPKPVVLLILDGVGSYKPYPGNAVAKANTPFLSQAWNTVPHGLLYASSTYVGLPENVKGNSEVGHTNIGAGRVVYQNLPRINKSIQEGLFDHNQALLELIRQAKTRQSALHLMGCLSDGNVHASINHLYQIIRLLKKNQIKNPVYIHAFTDGRDTPPQAAENYFTQLEAWIQELGLGSVASIIGRQLAMDRNKVWDRTKQAYDMLTSGIATVKKNWREVLQESYSQKRGDEHIKPYLITQSDGSRVTIKDNDLVFFYNFRPDRALQLTQALSLPSFADFQRAIYPKNLWMGTMASYGKNLPVQVAYPPVNVAMSLGRIIATQGMRQLRIAESEKFPHVTYFFNGGTNLVFEAEDRINIPSPQVATYDLAPEMSIKEVVLTLEEKISQQTYDFIVVNFANGDMVGHTGNFEAAIKAMEYVDWATSRIVKEALGQGGVVVATADHGNIEEMINPRTNQIDTEHSIYPVPLMLFGTNYPVRPLETGQLADLAPTILALLGVNAPSDMTGRNLLD